MHPVSTLVCLHLSSTLPYTLHDAECFIIQLSLSKNYC
jgi:hypothetical protein